jgi:hypothetical protein
MKTPEETSWSDGFDAGAVAGFAEGWESAWAAFDLSASIDGWGRERLAELRAPQAKAAMVGAPEVRVSRERLWLIPR